MSTPASGPTLRKTQSNPSVERKARSKRAGDGEKGSKIKKQQESRTRNALVFLGIMSLFFVAAMVKLRHNPSVSKSHHKLGSLRSNKIPQKEVVALEEVTRGQKAVFIPPNSIYSLDVSNLTGNMVSLNKFHGMVTLIVNVACL
jgi:hypothetical protein